MHVARGHVHADGVRVSDPDAPLAGAKIELRIRPDALVALRDTGRAYLKLVVATERDRDEAEALRHRFEFARERTLLMPEAASREALEASSLRVATWAQQGGLRFSTRLHLALWGGKRGT